MIKKKKAVKEAFLAEEALRKLSKALILMEKDAEVFDSRERGWGPAGTRLRKSLHVVVKAIQGDSPTGVLGFRKEIQEIKNEAKD